MNVDISINPVECHIRSLVNKLNVQLQTVMFPFLTLISLHHHISILLLHSYCRRLIVPDCSLLTSQTSSLLQRWWRSVDWHGLWWLASWPPSVSWQQLSCSAQWLPALSTNSAGGSSRGKEVRGKSCLHTY